MQPNRPFDQNTKDIHPLYTMPDDVRERFTKENADELVILDLAFVLGVVEFSNLITEFEAIPSVTVLSSIYDVMKSRGSLKVRVEKKYAAIILRPKQETTKIITYYVNTKICTPEKLKEFVDFVESIETTIVRSVIHCPGIEKLIVTIAAKNIDKVSERALITPGVHFSLEFLKACIVKELQPEEKQRTLELEIDGNVNSSAAIILTLQQISNLQLLKVIGTDLLTTLLVSGTNMAISKVIKLIRTTAGLFLRSVSLTKSSATIPDQVKAIAIEKKEMVILIPTVSMRACIKALSDAGQHNITNMTQTSPTHTQVHVTVDTTILLKLQENLKHIPGVSFFSAVVEKTERMLQISTSQKAVVLAGLLETPGVSILHLADSEETRTTRIQITYPPSAGETIDKLLPEKRRRAEPIPDVYVPTVADVAPIDAVNRLTNLPTLVLPFMSTFLKR
jgi:hypothetical protein